MAATPGFSMKSAPAAATRALAAAAVVPALGGCALLTPPQVLPGQTQAEAERADCRWFRITFDAQQRVVEDGAFPIDLLCDPSPPSTYP